MPAAVPPGHAFFLVGPTASGKTDAAHLLARETGSELLSADSMLVYRGMDIGTAKPGPGLRREIRYWGLDLVDPGSPFSLALYQAEAARAEASNAREGRGLVVAGGTGLYVKCLLEGLAEGPPADVALRRQWEERMAGEGIEPLRREVERIGPTLFESLTESDRANPRRLMRALELAAAGVMSVKRGWGDRKDVPAIAGLRLPAPALRARIEARVGRMYENGLLTEVRGLMDRGLESSPTACQAIGYAEAIAVLKGFCTEAVARRETVRRTWQLARRQMTWFRRQVPVRWIDIAADWPVEAVAAAVRNVWAETGPARLALPGIS